MTNMYFNLDILLYSQILNVTFIDFALEHGGGCVYDNLTIFDGSRQVSIIVVKHVSLTFQLQSIGMHLAHYNFHVTQETYCGDDKPETFISQNNTILIQFITDGSVVDRGFRLEWSSQGKNK